MVRVRKRSEEFDKSKLKKSIKKAGAKEADARKVTNEIAGKIREGTKTVQIWRWVIVRLRPLDRKAAEAYRTYRTRMKKKWKQTHTKVT